MNRWLARIPICLILGAITTVVVAWACVLLFPTNAAAFTVYDLLANPSNANISLELEVDEDSFGSGLLKAHGRQWFCFGSGRHSSNAGSRGAAPSLTPSWVLAFAETPDYAEAAGWPLMALSCRGHWDRGRGAMRWRDVIQTSVDDISVWTVNTQKVLPMRPIWLGFVVNTSFYAAVWFCPVFCFSASRKIMRLLPAMRLRPARRISRRLPGVRVEATLMRTQGRITAELCLMLVPAWGFPMPTCVREAADAFS